MMQVLPYIALLTAKKFYGHDRSMFQVFFILQIDKSQENHLFIGSAKVFICLHSSINNLYKTRRLNKGNLYFSNQSFKIW